MPAGISHINSLSGMYWIHDGGTMLLNADASIVLPGFLAVNASKARKERLLEWPFDNLVHSQAGPGDATFTNHLVCKPILLARFLKLDQTPIRGRVLYPPPPQAQDPVVRWERLECWQQSTWIVDCSSSVT